MQKVENAIGVGAALDAREEALYVPHSHSPVTQAQRTGNDVDRVCVDKNTGAIYERREENVVEKSEEEDGQQLSPERALHRASENAVEEAKLERKQDGEREQGEEQMPTSTRTVIRREDFCV